MVRWQASQSVTRVTDSQRGETRVFPPATLFQTPPALQGKECTVLQDKAEGGSDWQTEGRWELVSLWAELCTILAEETAEAHSSTRGGFFPSFSSIRC